MGWFDIIKNLSAEEQRKLLEDLNAPNTEKPKVPMPDMNAKTLDQMTPEERRKATMRRAGIEPKKPKLPMGVGGTPTITRPAPNLPPMPTTGKKPLKPVDVPMVDNKTKDLMSRLHRAAGDLNLVSTLNDYNRMPSKTPTQKQKKRDMALTPEMKKITQAATRMKLGNYKKPLQEIYNKDGSKISVDRQKTINAGKRVFGGGPKRGPPTAERRLSDRVRGQLKNKDEAGRRVQSVVNPPVEQRQSQKDEVARRIQEEQKKREETLARMEQQREARKPAPSVRDARRARIAASSSGGLPTSR